MPRPPAALLKAPLILAIPVLLVVISVRLLMTDAYLIYEYSQPDFPPDPLGLGYGERLLFASRNFAYVRTGGPISLLSQQTHSGAPLYNTRELKHMTE